MAAATCALCVVVTGVSLRARARAGGETIDRVLAVVDGELIMLSDVTAARDLGLMGAGQSSAADPDNLNNPTRALLSALIDRQLILTEVDRYAPPEPSVEAVDLGVRLVRARMSSPEAFDAALSRSGIDEKHLRETVREDLRIVAYEEQRFTVPAANDDELARFYRDHPAQFTRNGRVEPFDSVRVEVTEASAIERRQSLVKDWVAGLRRRADIVDLYIAERP
jgi:hypothetical protein